MRPIVNYIYFVKQREHVQMIIIIVFIQMDGMLWE